MFSHDIKLVYEKKGCKFSFGASSKYEETEFWPTKKKFDDFMLKGCGNLYQLNKRGAKSLQINCLLFSKIFNNGCF